MAVILFHYKMLLFFFFIFDHIDLLIYKLSNGDVSRSGDIAENYRVINPLSCCRGRLC